MANLSDLLGASGLITQTTLSSYATLTGSQTLEDKTLLRLIIQDYAESTREASVSGTQALDPSLGHMQLLTFTGNVTFTNSISSGQSVLIGIDDGTSYTATYPTVLWPRNGGIAPSLADTGWTFMRFWVIGTTLFGEY